MSVSAQGPKAVLSRGRFAASVGITLTLVLCGSAVAAGKSPRSAADAAPAALPVTSGVQEYSPSGQPVENAPEFQRGDVFLSEGSLCFDPSGRHLIVPGVGLFDNAGNQLASNWGSVPSGGRCVADGFGHVYVSSESAGAWTVTEYDIAGNVARPMNISVYGLGPLAIDLAPDECTLYYTGYSLSVWIGRFDVCTNTEEPPFSALSSTNLFDDLRVLPNWQVLTIDDHSASLWDTSGQVIRSWSPGIFNFDQRTLSLDPDGASFWTGSFHGETQFDLNSSEVIAQWQPSLPSIAAYGPALLGDADVSATVDSNPAGTAEAFLTRVCYSGQLTRIHLYVDASSTANQVTVGIYSNRLGRPGGLLERGTITNMRPGSWNYVDVPSMPVKAGQLYWVAVLGPHGGGAASFRDRNLRGLAIVSARHDLTDLPAHWSGGRWTLSGSLSAYGS